MFSPNEVFTISHVIPTNGTVKRSLSSSNVQFLMHALTQR